MIPVIETRRLTHDYGSHRALDRVDLEVPEGSFYALLGPNGAGKTTLMKILLGLLRPTSGELSIGGRDVRNLAAEDRTWIGYVAEGQELPGWMTLRQVEAFLAPLYPDWDPDLATHLRLRFRLPTDRKIRKMSRGERMKVALLAALAPRPRVLVMDEPFSGMDALVKDELVYGLLELAHVGDWTVFLCSHDIGEIEAIADWVGFLDRGRLILSESMDVLRSRFRRVDAMMPNGALLQTNSLPPTWLRPDRSGRRVGFVTCDHGSPGWRETLREALPGAESVADREATLREVFVALAGEGLGGRDWDLEGGL